jgi:hypothetical protein
MSDISRIRPRPHWRTATLGTVLGAAAVGAGLLATALAVHGPTDPFELDGNVANTAGTFNPHVGDFKDDWQNVFDLDGVAAGQFGSPIASSAEHELFIRDLADALPGNLDVMYNAGKDTLDLGDWSRKSVGTVTPPKDDITQAFAKSYDVVKDDGVHKIVYFGAGKGVDTGDAALGFWFFQQELQLTDGNGFSPAHTARNDSIGQRGDILVQADFVGGGKSSEIQIFEWIGFNVPANLYPGLKRFGPLLELKFASNANGPEACTTDDSACARTNSGSVASFWKHNPKSGPANFYQAQTFFEGAIDLTLLAEGICINSFLANTRSAHSETADLKDMAMGGFSTCGAVSVYKECKKVMDGATQLFPAYNAGNEDWTSRHTVTISNPGDGNSPIHDVMLKDTALGDDVTCKIQAYGGNPLDATGRAAEGTVMAADTFYKVANQVGAGDANQITVILECTALSPTFSNSVEVQAGQSDGASNLTASYAEVEADVAACATTLDPNVSVQKSCDGEVVLDPANGYKPKVCVNYTIQNTSSPAQKIDLTAFIDIRSDETQAALLSLLKNADDTAADNVLDPGEINTAKDCYLPAHPDGTVIDPDAVTFSDFARLTGTGRASGIPIGGDTGHVDSGTAICALCPIGLNDTPQD